MQQPRIVTWRAVSTEEQADRESLDHQQRLNREHAARWKGVLIAELEVPGLSRNIILWEKACREIPAFAQLNDLIERRAFDILMCMDVTRLARTSSLLAAVAGLCEAAGIRIYETSSPPASLDGPIATFDSRLITLLKGGMSEQEIRKFSERSYFGRQAEIKKGKHANTPPIGYKRIRDALGQVEIVIDEEYAPLVKTFYDLFLNHGQGLRTIAKEFTARGYARPRGEGAWAVTHIAAFLRNRWTYAGFASWGTRSKTPDKSFRVKASWEPLITEEMARWAEREIKLRGKAPRATGTPQRFSMVAECGVCGGRICVHKLQDARHKYTSYLCANICTGSSIREPVLRAAIREEILRLTDRAYFESLIGETPDEYARSLEQLEDTKRLLAGVRKERTRLTMAYTRDTITIEEYEPLMAELKGRHDRLAHTVTELETQVANTPNAQSRRDRLEEIRGKGLEMLDHPDVKTANAWLRRHFVLHVAANRVNLIKVK